MSKYIFSAVTNAFYPIAMKDEYDIAGLWPDNGVECDEDVFSEYSIDPPSGKMRGSDEKGNPSWVDLPELTKEQQISLAESHKEFLKDTANEFMNSKQWPGKAALGRIKGDELESYNIWLDYLDNVVAIDTSKAPDIEWPQEPS